MSHGAVPHRCGHICSRSPPARPVFARVFWGCWPGRALHAACSCPSSTRARLLQLARPTPGRVFSWILISVESEELGEADAGGRAFHVLPSPSPTSSIPRPLCGDWLWVPVSVLVPRLRWEVIPTTSAHQGRVEEGILGGISG